MQAIDNVRRITRRPSRHAVVALILLCANSMASASSSGGGDCDLSDARIPVSKNVDYSPQSAEKSDLVVLRERVQNLSSLEVNEGLNSSVPRKDITTAVDNRLNAEEVQVNAAEMLAEKRLLERQQSDGQNDTSTAKTLLPGVDTNNVQAFRKRMYRTDI